MSGKLSRNKGARAEREVKQLFLDANFKAKRTGSGICPDFKGDVYVEVDKNTKLVIEVKHYKDNFKTHYEQLCGSPVLIFNVTPEKDIVTIVMYADEFIKALKGVKSHVDRPNIYQIKRNNFDIKTLDHYNADTMRIKGEALKDNEYPILIKRANNKQWIVSGYKEYMEKLISKSITYPNMTELIMNDGHVPAKYRSSMPGVIGGAPKI